MDSNNKQYIPISFIFHIIQKFNSCMLKSIQTPLPLFQSKVADCLMKLGKLGQNIYQNQQYKPNSDKDVVLGEELYLTHIRPICAERCYISERVPTGEDLAPKKISKYLQEIEDLANKERIIQASYKIYEDKQESKANMGKKLQNAKKGGKKYQDQSKYRKQELKKNAFNQKFFTDLDFILAAQTQQKLQTEFGLNQNILEIKLMTFLYMRWYFDENYPKNKVNIQEIYECIHILIKVIKVFEDFVGPKYQLKFTQTEISKETQIKISPTLILDLKLSLDYMIGKYQYSNTQILFNFPRLAYDNKYNKFLSVFDIKPYPSQLELMKHIKNCIDFQKNMIMDEKLIIYNTMIGSGKTSFVLAIAKLVSNINANIKERKDKLKVLYACEIDSVRIQLARLAYNREIKFGFTKKNVVKRGNKMYEFNEIEKLGPKQFSLDKETDLIISDWEFAYNILDKVQYSNEEKQIYQVQKNFIKNSSKTQIAEIELENTILFVDEPTYSCYDSYSPSTNKLFEILSNRPPKIIIFASATMPNKVDLLKTHQLLQKHRPLMQFQQIKSKQFQIGCQFSTFEGQIYYPHTGIKNKKQMLNVISKLKENPFLMRLYTGTTLYFLLEKCKSLNINVPQFHLEDSQTTLTYKDFPKITLEILQILAKQNDKTIQQVCKFSNKQQVKYNPYDEVDSDDDIFIDICSKSKKQESFIDFSKILKEDAHKFLGGCLIATSDPLNFAEKHFKSWVRKIPQLSSWVSTYQQDKYDLQQQLQFIRGNALEEVKVIKNKEKPSVFPAHKRINTIHHYNYYFNKSQYNYSESLQKLNRSKIINPVPIQSIGEFLEKEVDEFVLKLLLCGIGIYTESGLSEKYLEKVEQLASLNQLAFIVCDKSLCYGVSFPISNVILMDDLATELNLNEIFQLIGRAGRVGRSWTARAFLQEKGLTRLFEYMHDDEMKMGNENETFQDLAEYYINNPQLKLRTRKTQIRFDHSQQISLSNKNSFEQEDVKIQIALKHNKNNLQQLKMSKISLIIINQESLSIFSNQLTLPTSKINYYEFPATSILFQDIPTIRNFQQCQIIDVQRYYKNEEQFIIKVIENVVKRALREYFKEDQLKYMRVTNNFKLKDFDSNLAKENYNFCVFISYEKSPQSNEMSTTKSYFKFNKLYTNLYQKLPELLFQYQMILKMLSQECNRLYQLIIEEGPSSILASEVKKIRQIKTFIKKSKLLCPYFKEFYEIYLSKIEDDYKKIITNQKHSQEQDIKIIILITKFIDLKDLFDQNFHIDQKIRKIMKVTEKLRSISETIPIQTDSPTESKSTQASMEELLELSSPQNPIPQPSIIQSQAKIGFTPKIKLTI